MIVKVLKQRYGIGRNIGKGNFTVLESLLSRSTALLVRRAAAIDLVVPAAIHGSFRSVQQPPPDFIGIAEGDGDGEG